jgi:hypothetical protein
LKRAISHVMLSRLQRGRPIPQETRPAPQAEWPCGNVTCALSQPHRERRSRSGRRAIVPARAAAVCVVSVSVSANHKVVPAGAQLLRPGPHPHLAAPHLCRPITKSFRPARNRSGPGRSRMCRLRISVGQSQSPSGRRGTVSATAGIVCVGFEIVSANPKVAPAGAELLRPLRKSSTPLE